MARGHQAGIREREAHPQEVSVVMEGLLDRGRFPASEVQASS